MEFEATSARNLDDYDSVLMCLICRNPFNDFERQPKFLPCHHTFCKECLREYVRQMGDELECPSCRKMTTIPSAGVAALQTNYYVKYIQGLVHGGKARDLGHAISKCEKHKEDISLYCKDCATSICRGCCSDGKDGCSHQNTTSTASISQECHDRLNGSFGQANALMEKKRVEVEKNLERLCEEKDDALRSIDHVTSQHEHSLHRRATLLKQKVINLYEEQVQMLETMKEDISTSMGCIVSLREYHEENVGHGLFKEVDQGVRDIDEVYENVSNKIKINPSHIVYEEAHGEDKFKIAVQNLGRVRTS